MAKKTRKKKTKGATSSKMARLQPRQKRRGKIRKTVKTTTVTERKNPKKRKAARGAIGGYLVAALAGSAVRYFDGWAMNPGRGSAAPMQSLAAAKAVMSKVARLKGVRASGVFKRTESEQAVKTALMEAVMKPKRRRSKKARRARTR